VATDLRSPYDDSSIDDVTIRRGLLSRVVAQVRHPPLGALDSDAGQQTASELAHRLTSQYPIFAHENNVEFTLSSGSLERRTASGFTWRLRSAKEDWQASFSRDFVSLDTSAYDGQSDFCERLATLLSEYDKIVDPPSATRIGLRYTNRITDANQLARLGNLIRPELVGALADKLPDGAMIAYMFSQASYKSQDVDLLLNWGMMPPNATYDLGLEPAAQTSWYLDIDAYIEGDLSFDVDYLSPVIRRLAHRAVRGFRWAITDEFIETYRVEP